MPAARLTLLSPATCIFSSTTRPIVQSRCPSQLQQVQQVRNASILSSLSDNAGAYNKRIRRGRGPASGKGKTSGRGMNGQKQHGKTPYRQNLGRHFNGGQTPEEVVHGKRGFDNQFSIELTPLNLDTLQHFLSTSRLPASSPTSPLTIRELLASRCLHGIKDGVKLLARNRTAVPLTQPIHITVSRASAAAIKAIEDAGGSVTTRYYTKAAINRVIKGETHPTASLLSLGGMSPLGGASAGAGAPSSLQNPHTVGQQEELLASTPDVRAMMLADMRSYPYRLPDPTGRKDLEYYRDPKHRGYLSWQVKEGQGPSLFFKTPGEIATGISGAKRRENKGKATGKGDNSLW